MIALKNLHAKMNLDGPLTSQLVALKNLNDESAEINLELFPLS
ncbi:33201_t:CDS:1 [Gigaspora margarita]|uniref:33201_t:CDS:1 n=1 Tax=Gigaspora margarita TaxID=4874 RepID=A0ABN7UJC9_GIGMA|nr:33201_t:CDS:1 [Gigaspora margarita]